MSSLMARISEDEEEYISLCTRYGEKVAYVRPGLVDMYGPHAHALRIRFATDPRTACNRCDGEGRRLNSCLEAVTACPKCDGTGHLSVNQVR